jgi:hypothetical protein
MFLAFIAAIGVMIVATDRTRLRFSLRSLLIAMMFAAVVIALVAAYARVVLTNS